MVVTGETFAEMKGSEEAERIAELERRIKLAVIGTFLISFHSSLIGIPHCQ